MQYNKRDKIKGDWTLEITKLVFTCLGQRADSQCLFYIKATLLVWDLVTAL